jgi:hypothetical protein
MNDQVSRFALEHHGSDACGERPGVIFGGSRHQGRLAEPHLAARLCRASAQKRNIDWAMVFDRAQTSRSSRPLLLATMLAAALVDAPAPAELLDRVYHFLAPRRDRPRGVGFGSFVGSPA